MSIAHGSAPDDRLVGLTVPPREGYIRWRPPKVFGGPAAICYRNDDGSEEEVKKAPT